MLSLIYLLMITVPPGGATACSSPEDKISLEEYVLGSTSRAIFQYCIATTPSSEELVQDEDVIGSPKEVAAKYCHSNGALTRLESSLIDILDAAGDFSASKKGELSGYHFIMSLSELVKTGHFRSARKNIGQALAKAHRKSTDCQNSSQLFRISETLFDQVRATTGNVNFAHLIGIRSVAAPTIVLKRKIFGNNGMAESISRDVVEITASKPVAIFNSALEHRVKAMDLAVSNHVDISHSILFREVIRDAQPGSTVFIVTSSRVPSINDDFMSAIGAAQASKIKICVLALDDEKTIGGRSLELYKVLAKFTNGRVYRTSAADLARVLPLIELSLTEGQASVLSRSSNKAAASFHVALDSTIKSLTVEAFCHGGGAPRVAFESHNSAMIPLVKHERFDFAFFLVRELALPGRYSLNITCESEGLSVDVKAETALQFRVIPESEGLVLKSLSLDRAKIQKTTMKQGHTKQHFAVLEDLGSLVKLKKSGNLINLPEDDDELPFFPDFIIPKALDLSIIHSAVEVDAEGENGEQIHREETQFISKIEVEGDVANMDFQPGETATIRVRVHNRKKLLHLTATDFEGWVNSISPSSTRPEDEFTNVEILVTAPSDVKIGSETQITITARDDYLISVDSASFSLSVGQTENPTVKKMVVETNIDNRFGRTIVQSKVQNSHPTPRDAVFSVFLPDSAFITSYKLYIRNHTYQGEIIDPVHADKKTDWLSPSTVVPDKNDDHEWKVKVRMDSWDEALFELVYDEPMSKSDGKHPYHVNLQGRQPIEELDFKVSLYDSDGISDVQVIQDELEEEQNIMSRTQVSRPFGAANRFGSGSGADIKIDETKKSAKISFSPSASIAAFSRGLAMNEGSSGAGEAESLEGAKFEMEYSTEIHSSEDFCTITADGQYFVQFCDPPVPSFVNDSVSAIGQFDYSITFVLDTSGSMFGEKLKASVDGLLAALAGLTPADNFNIVSSSRREEIFSQKALPATADSIARAKEWLLTLRHGGVSSIMTGMQSAIGHITASGDEKRIPLIVILSDSVSDATEENFQIALNSISNSAAARISISALAVGYTDTSSWQFLQRLSTRNRGLAFRLFDLTKFVEMIPEKIDGIKKFSRSLRGLTDVHFSFNSAIVADLTDTTFAHFTAGEDLVVLGKFVADAPAFLNFTIEYRDVEDNLISFSKSVAVKKLDKTGERAATIAKFAAEQSDYNPIRQQWAVTAVHQLLKRRAQATSQSDYDELTRQAAKLSRRFKIVSPVVSFLVRRPKSSANLIDPANENGLREKRSSEISESHEIHYQYRKLWWRSDEKDELEKTAEESFENNLQWAALTGYPLMFSRKLENSDEKVCLALPGGVVNGRVKLAENEQFSIVGDIRKFKLMSVTIRINEDTIKITNSTIYVDGAPSSSHPYLRTEDDFVHFSIPEAKSSFIVHRLGRRLDFSAELDLDEMTGFLPSMLEVESLMLEEITEKHKTAMLWVHGKHLLAHREENCWRLDAAETDVLFA